jgi:predicted nucleic acid-binding protein
VEDHLSRVLEKKDLGYINLVTLSEFYYILYRVEKGKAEEKELNLRSFGLKIVPVRDNSKLWKVAAIIKAQHSMSLADAFWFGNCDRP